MGELSDIQENDLKKNTDTLIRVMNIPANDEKKLNYGYATINVIIEAIIKNLKKSNSEEEVLKTTKILEETYDDAYNDKWKIMYYLVLCAIKPTKEYFGQIVNLVHDSDQISPVEKNYMLYSISYYNFIYDGISTFETRLKIFETYKNVFEYYRTRSVVPLERIDVKERNKNLVLIITGQFLSTEHGPTKTALDRAAAIMDKFGKKVVLINVAEYTATKDTFDLFIPWIPNYNADYSEIENISYLGHDISYFQCNDDMPNQDEIDMLMRYIYNNKPLFIVQIGVDNIIPALANYIVPVLSVGCVPSTMQYTNTDYCTTNKDIDEEDKKFLKYFGVNEDVILKSRFTFNVPIIKEKKTRADFGFKEDEILMIVVGARLDEEVNNEFICKMSEVIDEKTKLVFVGKFDMYDKYVEKYEILKNYSSYLGFSKDAVAIISLCDIYINPIRKGGGTSAVEAMYEHVVPVSTNSGDVSYNIGEDFCVNDYDEMIDRINRLKSDKNYYEVMSQKAYERALVMTDTPGEFAKTIREFMKREGIEE